MKKITILGMLLLSAAAFCQEWVYRTPVKDYSVYGAIEVTPDNTIYALDIVNNSASNLVVSFDYGATWKNRANVHGFDIAMTANATGYVLDDFYIYKSTDAFATVTSYWLNHANVKSVFFATPEKGFICGSDGLMMRTTNAGESWEIVPTGLTADFTDIYFGSESTGIAIAGSEVYRTADSGTTWTLSALPSPISDTMKSVFFASPTEVYIVGTSGIFLRSTDAGLTWTMSIVPGETYLYAVRKKGDLLLAVGYGGTICKSYDSGATWEMQSVPLGAVQQSGFNAIAFTNFSTLLGGEKRIVQSLNNTYWPNNQVWIESLLLSGISFSDDMHGVAVGNHTRNSIWTTDDGGVRWGRTVSSLNGSMIHGAHMQPNGSGIAYGDAAFLRYTNDFGMTWSGTSTAPSGGTTHFHAGYALSPTRFVLGSKVNGISTQIRGIYVCDNTVWTGFTDPGNVTAIDFADDLVGYSGSNEGKIYKTIDGGASWTACNTPFGTVQSIQNIQVISADKVFVDHLMSVDGGQTWQSGVIYPYYHFFDSLSGYAATEVGMIYKTTNGGASWEIIVSDVLPDFINEMCFLPNKVIAGGTDGDIYTIDLDGDLAVVPNRKTDDISIYPNPASDKIFISGNNISMLEIYNIHGSRIAELPVVGGSSDISALQSGLYIIKVQTPAGFITKKIVKK